jgi:hypothetical protein
MTLIITRVFHYAECHYVECRILFIIMLNVIMLSVIMLSAVEPNNEHLSTKFWLFGVRIDCMIV